MSTSQVKASFKQPSGSTPLWAHLLRRDISSLPSDPGITLTPTAPLDRNGTSMRLLLHDTQANFEKFSVRVDKLTAGVDDARKEVILVKNMFQQEHEQLEKDMVDLVNRSQTQVQHSVGEPAQAPKVEDLRKDIQSADRRLDFLDKRIDALHMLTQTQTQTLQTQSQALQTLQDQQGKIIAALMPLQPLLQAVPLHIESAQNHIKEMLLKIQDQTRPPVIPVPDHPSQLGKRSSSALHSDGPLSSPTNISIGHKRPRVDFEAPAVGLDEAQLSPISSNLPSQAQSRSYHAPLNRRQTTQVNRPQSHRFRSPLSALPLIFPVQQRAPLTPRVPLSDLPKPNDNIRANNRLSNSVAFQKIIEYSPSLTVNLRSPSLVSSGTARPPRTLRALPSQSTSKDASTSTSMNLPNRSAGNEPECPSPSSTSQIQQPGKSTTSPVPPRPPATFPISPNRPPFFSGNKPPARQATRPDGENPLPPDGPGPMLISAPSSMVPPLPTAKPMSIKDRRASFRNAHKRFIPLDDDEDEDDEG